jgi:ubiquinone/menaquinone biosynthesis C-methylase UbiE
MEYSLDNAQEFAWSSVTGHLDRGRVSLLGKYLLGNRVLDAGCGGGAYVDWLARRGLEAVGIDRHQRFLQMACDKGFAGAYVQADIVHLPFADKTFDCAYCFDVLEHVDDGLAISELGRVTKKRIIVAVPQRDQVMAQFGLTFSHYRDHTHLRTYTETSLRELLAPLQSVSVSILPELPIDLKSLVRSLAGVRSTRTVRWEMRYLNLRTAIRNRIWFKKQAVDARQIDPSQHMLARLLDQLWFREIYTGLVALVELAF